MLALVLHPRYRVAAKLDRRGMKFLTGMIGKLMQKLGKGNPDGSSRYSSHLWHILRQQATFQQTIVTAMGL